MPGEKEKLKKKKKTVKILALSFWAFLVVMKTKYEWYICDQLVLNTKAQTINFCLKTLGWDPKGTDSCAEIKTLALFSMWIVMSMKSKALMLEEGSLTFENEMCRKILAREPRKKSHV